MTAENTTAQRTAMHGLINRSIECFVRDSYGDAAWVAIADRSALDFHSFEPLLHYDPDITQRVLDAAVAQFNSTRPMMLEDLGTYLVSHPRMEPLRRLMRLGGDSYVEFLYSLEDLHDRARFAIDSLQCPRIELREHDCKTFTLYVTHDKIGLGCVLLGVARAMADDYGALAFLEHSGQHDLVETIEIELVQTDFAAGRDFSLAVGS